ncbi:MAG: endoglucanase [Methanobrevibacter sp.]|jgi:hypothetical protein|nr:endoglucanase [Candidatus Methanoflexus mossambicus]
MKNVNIIISVIIVLCIATGVTAYGLLSPDDNAITNTLQGMNIASDSGGSGSGSGSGSNNGSVQTGTNGGSGSSGGSGSGSGSSGGSGSGSDVVHDGMAKSEAKSIANEHISEKGATAGDPYWDSANAQWIVPVLDANGNTISAISVDPQTGRTGQA